MRLNEGIDPGMVSREYRDCAKGAHMSARRAHAGGRAGAVRYLRVLVERDGIAGVQALFNEAIPPGTPVPTTHRVQASGRDAA